MYKAHSLSLPQEDSNQKFRRSTKIHFVFALGATALLGLLAVLTRVPLLFASVGPTLIMLIHEPQHKSSRPLSILFGHSVAVAVALLSEAIFGVLYQPSAIVAGITLQRVAAASLSIAVTTLFEDDSNFYHPPAGSTALLVSLGIMDTLIEICAIVISAAILSVLALMYSKMVRHYKTIEK
jgi:CBS domain-containing membrane protein